MASFRSSVLGACIFFCGGCSGGLDAAPRPYPDPQPLLSAAPSSDPAGDVACVPEGGELAGAGDGGAARSCCEGLQPVRVYKGSIIRLDECEPAAGNRSVCVKCGDGRCGIGENVCDCPRDCPG
jgi:hypothetical protein